MQHLEVRKVCDGCWKRGVCDRNVLRKIDCTCPCLRDGWMHTDDPRSKK